MAEASRPSASHRTGAGAVATTGREVEDVAGVQGVALPVQQVAGVLDDEQVVLVANEMLSKPVWVTFPSAAGEMRPWSALGPDCCSRNTAPKAPGRSLSLFVSPVSVK